MDFFTIGYGGRSPESFLERLESHGVRTVADVRLRPDRASMGAYTKARSAEKGIERLLGERGIAYQHILELGNLFLDLEDWGPPYRELLRSSGRLLVARLESPAPTMVPALRREACGRLSPRGDRRASRLDARMDCAPHRIAMPEMLKADGPGPRPSSGFRRLPGGLVTDDDAFLEVDDGLGDPRGVVGDPFEVVRRVHEQEPCLELLRMQRPGSP